MSTGHSPEEKQPGTGTGTGAGMGNYTELHARSAFSFGDGTSTPEDLVQRAADFGHPAMALTDSGELGGIIRFVLEGKKQGIKPIAGAELKVGGRPAVFLARDQEGYRNLAALVTQSRLESLRGRPGLSFAQMAERSAGLHALTGAASGPLAALIQQQRPDEAARTLARWREAFGDHLAIEVQLHHVSGAESALAAELIDLAERSGVPWVVTNEPRYLDDDSRLVHDLQTALRAGGDIDTAARRGLLLPNGEWRLKSPAEMRKLWEGREAGIEETQHIAAECDFSLGWLRPPLPRLTPLGDEDEVLRQETYDGAIRRWGSISERQRQQLDHELRVIAQLGFAGFFLIMNKVVRFARSQGILCQGRGSAANSAVAFCLEITAVDPVKHNLLFERFLSEARADGMTEAPDIDVDFEAHRREEVLNHVYETYGRGKSAITGVTQTYHAPTAVQDVMRALGYPTEQAFSISKRIHKYQPAEGADMIEKEYGERFGLEMGSARVRALLTAVRALDGIPRMRSTHPGGFVLSSAPLGEYMPIEETAMGRTILQFDKDDLDAAGVPKFDFLGLGGLSATRLAFDAIELRTGKRLDLYSLPQDDEKTFEMISRGDTVGTFQIESRAQIASILQTRPERLYDLVVQVALIRPGPIQGQFVRPYTRRRRGLEEATYADERLRPILERTYGIPIFQEQAMSIAMALGGFSAAQADELRRAMGHKRKLPRLQAAFDRLRDGLVANGLDLPTADGVIQAMQGFANYGFPESHAWSFALIAYATAYLKAHYPADFFLGLLNAWPMGFYSPATLVHDARRHGVEVRGPCMRDGEWECTLETTSALVRECVSAGDAHTEDGKPNLCQNSSVAVADDSPTPPHSRTHALTHSRTSVPHTPALRVGWRHIRGLGAQTLERLREARMDGPFVSVEDVVRRARLARSEALHLARAGALEAFEPGRRKAAWEALRAAGDTLPLAPARRLPFDPEELEGDELIFLDYLATGVCVNGHPMEHLRERLRAAGIASSADIQELEDDQPIVVAGLVVARQHPSTAKGTVFLLMEDEWGFINVIVPAKLYEKNRETVNYSPFLMVEGLFEREGPVLNVVGRRFKKIKTAQLALRSHDFH